jgi:hypothetical protein
MKSFLLLAIHFQVSSKATSFFPKGSLFLPFQSLQAKLTCKLSKNASLSVPDLTAHTW